MAEEQTIGIKIAVAGAEKAAASMGYVQQASEVFASKVTSKLGGMFSAVAIGAMAFDKIGEAMQKNMATAKQIGSLSTKFHIDPKEVHSLMLAANDAGVAVRTLLQGMKTLGQFASKAIIDPDKADIFRQMGVDMEKLTDLSSKPAKHLADIAVGLMRIDNETDRTKAGTMLLGRQYQQLLPLIEKLGTDAEARAQYLDNENAMTAEQVEQNKEIARIQSELNNSWESLVASITPVILAVTTFMNLIAKSVSWVKELGTAWKMYVKEQVVKAEETMLTKETALREAVKSGNLSKEDAAALEKIKKEGGTLDDFVATKHRQWEKEMNAKGRGVGGTIAAFATLGLTEVEVQHNNGLFADGFEQEGARKYGAEWEKGAQARRKKANQAKAQRERELSDELDQERKDMKEKHDQAIEDIMSNKYLDTKGLTEDQIKEKQQQQLRVEEVRYTDQKKAHVAGAKKRSAEASAYRAEDFMEGDVAGAMAGVKEYVAGEREQYEKEYTKFIQHWAHKSGLYGKALCDFLNSVGYECYYDPKKSGWDAIVKGKKPISADDFKAKSGISFKAEDEAARKKKEKEAKGLAVAYLKESKDLKGEAKARHGLQVAQAEQGMAQTEFDEKKKAEDKALQDLEARQKKVDELEKKKQELEARQAEIAKMPESAAKRRATEQLFAEGSKLDTDIGEAKPLLAGAKKTAEKATSERVAAEKELIGKRGATTLAEAAVRDQAEKDWLDEKRRAKELAKDKKDYEKELQEMKYKNMKLEGKSQKEIMMERFDDQMARYKEATEEREAIEAELADRLAKRQAEHPGEHVELTDAEKALQDEAREKQDKERQGTEEALYSMSDLKSHAVVSDLGKMGGGGAVQFGTNPVDEIRKSNKWLEIIAKNSSTTALSKVGSVRAKLQTSNDLDEGLFGDDVPM
jgi:hypothetical protein